MSNEPDSFTCARCERTFAKDNSDAEAMIEMVRNFGADAAGLEYGVLCTECYELFMRWLDALTTRGQQN